MTTERERIDRMLAEGKVSAAEAQRLRAALEKAEGEEAQAPAGPQEKVTRPRLSRLALAGALGLPAAGVTFLFVMGLAIVLGVIEERAAGGGLMMAAAVALVGLGLSIAGLIVTRRSPDRLSGRGLALTGIVVPVALTLLGGIASAVTWHQYRKRAEAMAREAVRERQRKSGRFWAEMQWKSFARDVASAKRGGSAPDFTARDRPAHAHMDVEAIYRDLDPDWVVELKLEGPSESDLARTVISPRFIALIPPIEDAVQIVDYDLDVDAGRGTVSVRIGTQAKHVRVLVPVKRVTKEGEDDMWYLARAPVQFPDGEPEWLKEAP